MEKKKKSKPMNFKKILKKSKEQEDLQDAHRLIQLIEEAYWLIQKHK